MKKWYFRIVVLVVLAVLIFMFRVSWENGELVIRFRTHGQRQELKQDVREVGDELVDMSKKAAGKVRFEGASGTQQGTGSTQDTGKDSSTFSNKKSKPTQKGIEELRKIDRDKLEKIIGESLK